MVAKRREDAPDIHDQYRAPMIALCDVAEYEFPISSYETHQLL